MLFEEDNLNIQVKKELRQKRLKELASIKLPVELLGNRKTRRRQEASHSKGAKGRRKRHDRQVRKLRTQIWICDRHNLELIAQSETEPWYQWHFSNGCLDETGNLVIEFVRYKDFATNQYLREVATGKTTTPAEGQLWQIVLDPKTAQILDSFPLLERHCAFPLPNPQFVGKSWRYTYLSTHRNEVINSGKMTEEVLTAIARYDRQTSTISITDMGADIYPCEPIYVSNNDNPGTGWLLTVVYNGNQDRSEVRIYQSDRLEDEPLCCLALTEVIPHGFHGTWSSQ